jgi:hypothetical protein
VRSDFFGVAPVLVTGLGSESECLMNGMRTSVNVSVLWVATRSVLVLVLHVSTLDVDVAIVVVVITGLAA